MGNVVIKGQQEKIFFKAANYYNADLKVDVYDDDNGGYIVNGVPMTEIVEPVEDVTTTVVEDAAKDDTIIELDSTDGLSASDRINVDGEIYRIITVNSDNTVKLHRGLIKDVAKDADVTLVGNLGIYRVTLFITTSGNFVIQAKDKKYGLQLADSISIKENSLEDLFTYTNTNIDENERIIKETSSFTIII